MTRTCKPQANAAAGAAAAAPAHIGGAMATMRDAMVGFMSRAPTRSACEFVMGGKAIQPNKQLDITPPTIN